MYQQKQKEDITTIGILSGLFLSSIPLYYFIRIFKSIEKVKKGKEMAVTSLLLSFVAIVVLFITALIFPEPSTISSEYSSTTTLESSIILVNVTLWIVVWIFQMVTGFQIKKGLEESIYDSVSDEERYEVAKVAGVFLIFVPVYRIVRVISDRDKIRTLEIRTKPTGLMLTFIILSFINFIPYIVIVIGLPLFIIATILGNQMNTIFLELTYLMNNSNRIQPMNMMSSNTQYQTYHVVNEDDTNSEETSV